MSDGVVLLHGIAQTSSSMRVLERALTSAGYTVLNLDDRSRHRPLEALTDAIHPAMAGFAEQVSGSTHVVEHSMAACWPASASRVSAWHSSAISATPGFIQTGSFGADP